MFLPVLVALVLSGEPVVSAVPCQTIADCWLDPSGNAIARPKKQKGKPLPKGDCGKNLNWLRRRLTCEQKFCTVQYIGDKC